MIYEQVNLISVATAAERWNMKYSTLTSRIKRRAIPSYSIGGRIYINPADMVDWLQVHSGGLAKGDNWFLVKQAHEQGLSDVAIAEAVGISRERVRQIRAKQGLLPNSRRPGLPKIDQRRMPSDNSWDDVQRRA